MKKASHILKRIGVFVKQSIVSLFKKAKISFCTIYDAFRISKNNRFVYVFLTMFVLGSGLLCYSQTTSNYSKLWANVLAVSEDIKKNNYMAVCVFSSPLDNTKDEKKLWDRCTTMVNRNISSIASSLNMSCDDEGAFISYEIYINNKMVSQKTIGDAVSYFGESLSPQMSAINVIRYDWTMDGISFNNYNFPGKEASSYIPMSLADAIIALDDEDEYTTYDDLLGEQYSIKINNEYKNFSINNIYYENKNFGKYLRVGTGSPIITNSKAVFNYGYSKSFSMFANEPIFLRRGYRFYSTPYQNDNNSNVYLNYLRKDSKLINSEMEQSMRYLLSLYKDEAMILPFNGINFVSFGLSFVPFLINIVLYIYCKKKDKMNAYNYLGLNILYCSVSIMFFVATTLLLLNKTMTKYLILNPLLFFGIGFLPIAFLFLSFFSINRSHK